MATVATRTDGEAGARGDGRSAEPRSESRPAAGKQKTEPRSESRANADPLIGRVIADRYRIVGHLGRGGMGVVYKVEHLRIGKLMAMKLLTGELSRNRDVVRRFKREALAASRLTSINTVQVWDFGHSDGLTYLVMELVAGDDLGKVLKAEGPMPFRRVAQIAVQVCNSMIEAHERGIVHRDIKPENILILHAGGEKNEAEQPDRAEARQLTDLVKVLDFGLAKLHDDERPHTNDVTTTGAIVGTPFYMSPEQIRGEPVDGRADIYALGAVMYRAVTGVPPFQANTPMAVLTQHLTEPLIPPNERAPELKIPLEASTIIVRAMEKDRDQRYQSAIELREALIGYLATTGVSSGYLRTGALEAIAATGVPSDGALARIRPSREPASLRRAVMPATRDEIQAYGRKRRVITAAITGIALAIVGGIVTVARSMHGNVAPPHPPGLEVENNDDLAHANPLTLGTPARGYLGKRISPDQADVDVWSFDVPATNGAPLLELSVTPLPNVPMCAELLGQGGAVLGTFCRARGKPITVSAFRVQPGPHFIRVTQDRTEIEQGEKPPIYENVSDDYSLRVAIASRAPGLEIEPNDSLADAQVISVGDAPVDARVGWRADRDTFCAGGVEGDARFVVIDRAARPGKARLSVESFNGEASIGKSAIEDPVNGWTSAPFPLSGARQCITVVTRDGMAEGEGYKVSLEKR